MTALRASVLVALLLAARAGRADEPPAPAPGQDTSAREVEAKALYEAGVKHYNLAEYDQAISAYKEAYRLFEAPGFLFNIALAYRMKGDCLQAIQFYKIYLRVQPEAQNRKDVEARVASLAACAADQEKASQAIENTVPVAPTSQPTTQPTRLKVPLSPPPPSPPPPGRNKKIMGWSLGGLGVVTLGVATFYGLDALSAQRELDELYDETGQWNDDLTAVEARGRRSRLRAVVWSLVGGAAVATGVVLIVSGRREARAAEASLAVVTVEGGGSVVWTSTF
jgi:tetratricopeptide (TPR) repeat protein